MYSERAVGSEVAWWPQTPPIGNLLVGWDGIIVSFSSWQNYVKILVEQVRSAISIYLVLCRIPHSTKLCYLILEYLMYDR